MGCSVVSVMELASSMFFGPEEELAMDNIIRVATMLCKQV